MASAGEPLDQALSSPSGTFALRGLPSTDLRLLVSRFGYKEYETTLHGGSGGGRLLIELDPAPVAMEELSVASDRTCPVEPDEARLAWGMYMTALPVLEDVAAGEAGAREYYVHTIREWVSQDNTRRGRRGFNRGADTTLERGPSPISTLPPLELVRDGFVRILGDDEGIQYYLPRAETVLADEFLVTQCLSVARRDAELGIGFDPRPDDQHANIRGVLWLSPDGAPAALEFHFVGLKDLFDQVERPRIRAMMLERSRTGRVSVTRVKMDESRYGGRLDFQLTDAGWITSAWELRMPWVGFAATFDRYGIDVMPFSLLFTWTGTTVRVDVP